MNAKLIRLVGHDYHIFKVLDETKLDEVKVLRLTPEFDQEGKVVPATPIIVHRSTVINQDQQHLLMFVRIYCRSVGHRLVQLHALQNALMGVIDILTGNDENQAHR